jgi:hypothetical protein
VSAGSLSCTLGERLRYRLVRRPRPDGGAPGASRSRRDHQPQPDAPAVLSPGPVSLHPDGLDPRATLDQLTLVAGQRAFPGRLAPARRIVEHVGRMVESSTTSRARLTQLECRRHLDYLPRIPPSRPQLPRPPGRDSRRAVTPRSQFDKLGTSRFGNRPALTAINVDHVLETT